MFGLGVYPDPHHRLEVVIEMMREMSLQTDPQAMVQSYGRRMQEFVRSDGFLSISRRGLEYPFYRVTRSAKWARDFDPWKNRDRLPLLKGGILAELIYSNRPHLIHPFHLNPADPAAEYLASTNTLAAIPHYDKGESVNMVLHLFKENAHFTIDDLPEMVWVSNLFGRTVNNLALTRDLQAAYEVVDNELKVVADLQRSLLPAVLPDIPGVELGAYYNTARRAGGDYYDFFELPDGRWGWFIADVSGHGTPAAVVMAMMHSLAHAFPGPPSSPSDMLAYLNDKLANGPASNNGTFVTAFYGIYDPATREIEFASAGHHPPRLLRKNSLKVEVISPPRALPLGILPGETFSSARVHLSPGDHLVLFTDGITETFDHEGNMFDYERLDAAIVAARCESPQTTIDSILKALDTFAHGRPPDDDRTLVVAVAK